MSNEQLDCPVCGEVNSSLTMVWSDRLQDFICEDCWRPGEFVYFGA